MLLEGADSRIDAGFVHVSEIIALNSYAANSELCANRYSIHTAAFLFCSSFSERNVWMSVVLFKKYLYFLHYNTMPFCFSTQITHPRYGSPYPWPLNRILSYQKQWEVRRKMKAIGWAGKTLEQVRMKSELYFFTLFPFWFLFFFKFFNRHWRVVCFCNRCSEMYVLYFKLYQESGICLQQQ